MKNWFKKIKDKKNNTEYLVVKHLKHVEITFYVKGEIASIAIIGENSEETFKKIDLDFLNNEAKNIGKGAGKKFKKFYDIVKDAEIELLIQKIPNNTGFIN